MTENPEQQEAIKSLEKIIFVLAGAGSGKTKTLIDKIKFYINERRVEPKNILAIWRISRYMAFRFHLPGT